MPRLENWSRLFVDYDGEGSCLLTGDVYDDGDLQRFHDGTRIVTSRVKAGGIDAERKAAQTKNTLYKLGEPSLEEKARITEEAGG